MSLFDSLFGIVTDAVKIVAAPVQVAVDLTRAVTKPVADVAQEAAKALGDSLKVDDK